MLVCLSTCNFLVSREGGWTDEATDLFEDLCHVAQWRVLMSRVDCYKEREQGGREGSPIPVVDLYDTSGAQVSHFFSYFFFVQPSVWYRLDNRLRVQVPAG
jgi:hypothetical protein